MNDSLKSQIIKAIKNFDIKKLESLLDDEKSYMDVPKSLFVETLEKRFESAKKNGCYSFDDVFFGICDSCNKGCEGMTFFSNSGHYLDIFMEGDDKSVTDIYVCYKLHNFTNLEKTHDLGPSFCLDEAVLFKPDSEYTIIKEQYKSLLKDIQFLKPNIRLNDLVTWYDGYSHIRNFVENIDPFVHLEYKLYSNAYTIISDIDSIVKIRVKAHHTIDALIDFQKATTEREKLIWLFENKKNRYGSYRFIFPKELSFDSFVYYKSDNIELTIDISGYEYVMDYFRKLDNLYNQMLEKYKPLPEHFEQSPTGSVISSLENYLRLHNVHLDVVEKYERKD